MAIAANITSALSIHTALVAASEVFDADAWTDAMTDASREALDAALDLPSSDFSDVRMKLAALIDDAGCGLVAVEDLAFISRDFDARLGRAVQ